jgi:hypothetical protein
MILVNMIFFLLKDWIVARQAYSSQSQSQPIDTYSFMGEKKGTNPTSATEKRFTPPPRSLEHGP